MSILRKVIRYDNIFARMGGDGASFMHENKTCATTGVRGLALESGVQREPLDIPVDDAVGVEERYALADLLPNCVGADSDEMNGSD